jgi:hypothetical protein
LAKARKGRKNQESAETGKGGNSSQLLGAVLRGQHREMKFPSVPGKGRVLQISGR